MMNRRPWDVRRFRLRAGRLGRDTARAAVRKHRHLLAKALKGVIP